MMLIFVKVSDSGISNAFQKIIQEMKNGVITCCLHENMHMVPDSTKKKKKRKMQKITPKKKVTNHFAQCTTKCEKNELHFKSILRCLQQMAKDVIMHCSQKNVNTVRVGVVLHHANCAQICSNGSRKSKQKMR